MTFNLNDLFQAMGQAGRLMNEIGACEGAAGNISVFLRQHDGPGAGFSEQNSILLPVPVPELAGSAFLVTGSGCRLREVLDDPLANLGYLVVEAGGLQGSLFTAPQKKFSRLTSEFNSHLAVHADQAHRRDLPFHALVHAQPQHLTFLSHHPQYQDELAISRAALRWQPEAILNLPEGLGYLPFCVPGSDDLMRANVAKMATHQLVVWARHGIMVRSDHSLAKATDLIEYAETGARYECLNLTSGAGSSGLSAEEIRAICAHYGVKQAVF